MPLTFKRSRARSALPLPPRQTTPLGMVRGSGPWRSLNARALRARAVKGLYLHTRHGGSKMAGGIRGIRAPAVSPPWQKRPGAASRAPCAIPAGAASACASAAWAPQASGASECFTRVKHEDPPALAPSGCIKQVVAPAPAPLPSPTLGVKWILGHMFYPHFEGKNDLDLDMSAPLGRFSLCQL